MKATKFLFDLEALFPGNGKALPVTQPEQTLQSQLRRKISENVVDRFCHSGHLLLHRLHRRLGILLRTGRGRVRPQVSSPKIRSTFFVKSAQKLPRKET